MAPPLLDDPLWLGPLFEWVQPLPKPESIVIASAHWESAPRALSAAAAHTLLVYDFGGFHPRCTTMQYLTPDVGALARRSRERCPPTCLCTSTPAGPRLRRLGAAHGHYPLGDIPVRRLSMPARDPSRPLAIGGRLRPRPTRRNLPAANRPQMSRMLSFSPEASWTTTTPGNGPVPSGRARCDLPSDSVLIIPHSHLLVSDLPGDRPEPARTSAPSAER